MVSSGAINHSKCRVMQACFALAPQDNAVRAFRSPRVRALDPSSPALWTGFWAFNVSRRIPISTFGHSNACRQSRRADCGLLHACLRSSAACAFCGVLCVLDGFVMKCPKVETMYLDGAEIPGSVNFGGVLSPFYSALGPFLWCAELVLTARGLVALCFLGSDEQICLRETTIKFTCGGAKNKKDAPKGALHAN